MMDKNLYADYFVRPIESPIRALFPYLKDPSIVGFAGGNPAVDVFDVAGLRAAMSEAMCAPADGWAQYAATDGLPRLRQAIIGYMGRLGAQVDEASLLLTAGSQQALDLLARVLVNPGDRIIVERPTYPAAIQTFKSAGAHVIGVDSEPDGICMPHLRRILETSGPGNKPKALYCVPTFGNPTGRTFSEQNRRDLLALASEFGLLIIEDDPYSALKFEPLDVPSIHRLAQRDASTSDLVVYLSSLSKVMAPGMRIGWIVGAASLVRRCAVAKQSVDLCSSTWTQAAAAVYIEAGRLEAHLPHACKVYGERAQAMQSSLSTLLGDRFEFDAPRGGMFIWGRFPAKVNSQALLKECIAQGMVFVPGDAFYADNADSSTARLCFSMCSPERIEEGVRRLAKALDGYESAQVVA